LAGMNAHRIAGDPGFTHLRLCPPHGIVGVVLDRQAMPEPYDPSGWGKDILPLRLLDTAVGVEDHTPVGGFLRPIGLEATVAHQIIAHRPPFLRK